MRIIRYLSETSQPVLAAVRDESQIYPLPQASLIELVQQAEKEGRAPLQWVEAWMSNREPSALSFNELELLVPVEAPEVWAAGVTYQKSREARNYEATGGKLDVQTFYDKVYDAVRPELFLKSTKDRTIGPGKPVYLRSDSNWQIPEPELGLVLDSKGELIGYTIGNDMSCRDIEGENPLYLPQAKIWKGSCSVGPTVLLADAVDDPYRFQITCRIFRNEKQVFSGHASVSQLKRRLEELVAFLRKDNVVFDGTVLLTGTCIVPPNEFSLQSGDIVEIEIAEIGKLQNPVELMG